MPDDIPIPPVVEPPKATVESVKETRETTTTKGDATALPSPPPPVVADDWIRRVLAGAIFVQFTIVVGILLYLVITHQGELPPTSLNVVLMVLTTESNFMMAVVMYYWGSSSGSTAKSAGKAA